MSKFHKTLKNHFIVGEEYNLSLRPIVNKSRDLDSLRPCSLSGLDLHDDFRKHKYVLFNKGHLIFEKQGTTLTFKCRGCPKSKIFGQLDICPECVHFYGIAISGAMILNNEVVIKSADGKTFTVNGWIKE